MLLWFRFRFREKIVADLHTPLPLLKRIATAVVLIPIVLALTLRAPVWVVAAVVAMVALLTIHEFLKLTESYGVQPLRWPLYIFTGLFFLLLAISAGGDDSPALDGRIPHRHGIRRRARSVSLPDSRYAAHGPA